MTPYMKVTDVWELLQKNKILIDSSDDIAAADYDKYFERNILLSNLQHDLLKLSQMSKDIADLENMIKETEEALEVYKVLKESGIHINRRIEIVKKGRAQ